MEDVMTEAYSEETTEMSENLPTEEGNSRESTNDYQNVIAEREAALQAAQAEREKLANELKSQRQRAEDLERSYRSYQKNTTQKLQRLSELERQMQAEGGTREELLHMRAMIQRLANAVLDENDKEQLNLEIEKASLKYREQQMAAQQQMQQTPQPEQRQISEFELELQKRDLFRYYAPESVVDPADTRIDWAGDAPNLQEWVRRFTASVRKIEQQDLQAQLTKEREDAIKAAKEEAARIADQAKQEAEQAKANASTEARRQEEERLRARGIDVVDTAARPEGGDRKLINQMQEELNEDLLLTPEGRKKWAELERKYRDELFRR